jgi:hypothetical protein
MSKFRKSARDLIYVLWFLTRFVLALLFSGFLLLNRGEVYAMRYAPVRHLVLSGDIALI